MTALWILLSILLPWAGALTVWLVGDERPRAQHTLASCFAIAGGLASLGMLTHPSPDPAISLPLGGIFGTFTLVADGLGIYLAIIATVVGGLAVVFSMEYMKGEQGLGRYYALVLLFIGAMVGLALSGSLLHMFLFWEITAFCSYALISFHNDDPKAVRGGIKALIVTQLGGIGLLLGALTGIAYLGSHQISALLASSDSLPANIRAWMAFGFLVAAAAKSAQVPFHTWLPDAMEAPTPVSALIHAATMVNAGVYLLVRFYPLFESVPGWSATVVTLGVASALLAGFLAVLSYDLKRVLAYSTVSQLGYMFYAIGAGGILASQFHLLSHALFKALLFLAAGAVIHHVGTRDMREMHSLGRTMPGVRLVFIVGFLALVGLPPANGFLSKEMIFEQGLVEGPLWALVGMVLGAGITALYAFRMTSMVFDMSHGEQNACHAHNAVRIPLTLLAIGTLTSWLLAGDFGKLLSQSLPYHHVHSLETTTLLIEVLRAPLTYIALALIACGILLWHWRSMLQQLMHRALPVIEATARGAQFEWLNELVITATLGLSRAFRKAQTGQMSWNVTGIVGGLGILLIILIWGA
ncbi:MAG TPA: NADH-quinone oxidoreductase subunit L [Chloroflexi bacterium]|nr:NADH-quinone oxidoreductase subunit L [Chloroflexota bacterium]